MGFVAGEGPVPGRAPAPGEGPVRDETTAFALAADDGAEVAS